MCLFLLRLRRVDNLLSPVDYLGHCKSPWTVDWETIIFALIVVLVDEFAIFAFHCRVQALVWILVDYLVASCTALLVAAYVRCDLVTGMTSLNWTINCLWFVQVFRALPRWLRVAFVKHETLLAEHILVRQSGMECWIYVTSSRRWLSICLNVSKLWVVHHAHVTVAFRHLACLRLTAQLLLLLHHERLRAFLLQRVGIALGQ